MRSAFYNLINFINTAKVDDVYANAAKKILENINKIPELNITDVAEMCFVSTATISRLCRKLNYESFSDFKMDVTMNLRYFNHVSQTRGQVCNVCGSGEIGFVQGQRVPTTV